jgi:hypothetical protein
MKFVKDRVIIIVNLMISTQLLRYLETIFTMVHLCKVDKLAMALTLHLFRNSLIQLPLFMNPKFTKRQMVI